MGNLGTNDPRLYERLLLDELSQIAEKRGVDSDVLLLWAVLEAVEAYFDSQAVTRNDALFSEINAKFSFLVRSLAEAELGRKLETDSRTKAMGLLVEGLIYFGMPRKAAIQAVSAKLAVSETHARVGNELFRKVYGRSENAKGFDVHMVISVHRSLIEKWLEDQNYPTEHPKSKQSFQKLYALLNGGTSEE